MRSLSFRQPESLAALDLVIWFPDAIAGLYGPATDSPGVAPLGWLRAQELVMHTRAWREEFRAFLARGGSLVVFSPSFDTLALHTPQDIVAYDPLEALPEKVRVLREPMEPAAVECRHGEPFRSLFAAIADLLAARSSLFPLDSQAIADSRGRVCGLYRFVHPGRLLVLPSVADAPDPASAQRLVEAIAGTIHGLRHSADQRGSAALSLLPPSTEEARLAQALESIAEQKHALEKSERELRARLAWLREIAVLRIEDAGDSLPVAAAALQSLGGRILHEFDQPDSRVIEVPGETLMLMLAQPGERASACRMRLDPMLRARCVETGQTLQPIVLITRDAAADGDDPAGEAATGSGSRWRFLRARDLYEACSAAKPDGLAGLWAVF